MRTPDVVAVLDVGKTNKKIALYDRDLRPVDLRKVSLDAEPGPEEGIYYEPTSRLFEWACDTLGELSKDHSIGGLGITTHGATLAALDGNGDLAHPVLSYLSPAGDRIEAEFDRTFGPPERLHAETCTAPFGFANAAKQILFLQKVFPNDWAKARSILFYPQFLGYLFSRGIAADPTYLGCHSYLWLPEKNEPSPVARTLGVAGMLPARIASPWDSLGGFLPAVADRCGVEAGTPVAVGLHDSNASLLPYLAKGFREFTLNSTGTWTVAMTPSDNFRFEDREIGTKTFYNLSAFGKPVKTALFPGGLEFSEFSSLAGVTVDGDTLDEAAELCRERDLFLTGGIVPGAKAFAESRPAAWLGGESISLEKLREDGLAAAGIDGKRFRAALDLSLAIQSVEVLDRAGRSDGGDVFVEGGFAQNDAYCRLLAALLPRDRVCRTELKEATAFGAALCVRALVDGVSVEDLSAKFSIQVDPVTAPAIEGLEAYAAEYRRRSGEG